VAFPPCLTAPGFMHSVCRLLLVVALCGTGCDRAKNKSKRRPAEVGGSVAVGKLVITPPAMETARGSAYEAGEAFIEQQLGLLGGAEIRRQAEDFLKSSRPELKPAPAVIQVERLKGSNIVSVIGRGDSPEFSAALVDAVMEAYVTAARPAEPSNAVGATADTEGAEKNLKEAERAWTAFRLDHDLSRLKTDLAAAERRQKRLAVAKSFYEEELGLGDKLSLEQDIRRRQVSSGLPPEMPAELAALVRTTLTVGELAYLSALKGTNAPATEAARKEAEKDREDRIRSLRKQMEIAGELATAAADDIARLASLQKESAKLEAQRQAAEAAYAEKKAHEKNMGGGLNDSAHPMVSITERASRGKGG
jgi:hypothetical protein